MTNFKSYFLFLLIYSSSFIKVLAVNYMISFTGSGASTVVDSVIVKNLTQSTEVKVPGGNILNLSSTVTGINNKIKLSESFINITPNPIQNTGMLSFYVKNAGVAEVRIYNLIGQQLSGITQLIEEGQHSFQLALPRGTYLIRVSGVGFNYFTKAISVNESNQQPTITNLGATQISDEISSPQRMQETSNVTTFTYHTGDRLLYKGYSAGIFCTILTDLPTFSKSTNFIFKPCTDASGNNYELVTIGTQTWMAENLKTVKYRNGDLIENVTDSTAWLALTTGAWCNFNNDILNGLKYGKLYNYQAVKDIRNLAPVGWHIPSDTEWTLLENYLISHGGNFDGSTIGNCIAKGIANNNDWFFSSSQNTIGLNQNLNNSTGFSALPSGGRIFGSGAYINMFSRCYWWSSTADGTTNAWMRWLYYGGINNNRTSAPTACGFSIRCLMD